MGQKKKPKFKEQTSKPQLGNPCSQDSDKSDDDSFLDDFIEVEEDVAECSLYSREQLEIRGQRRRGNQLMGGLFGLRCQIEDWQKSSHRIVDCAPPPQHQYGQAPEIFGYAQPHDFDNSIVFEQQHRHAESRHRKSRAKKLAQQRRGSKQQLAILDDGATTSSKASAQVYARSKSFDAANARDAVAAQDPKAQGQQKRRVQKGQRHGGERKDRANKGKGKKKKEEKYKPNTSKFMKDLVPSHVHITEHVCDGDDVSEPRPEHTLAATARATVEQSKSKEQETVHTSSSYVIPPPPVAKHSIKQQDEELISARQQSILEWGQFEQASASAATAAPTTKEPVLTKQLAVDPHPLQPRPAAHSVAQQALQGHILAPLATQTQAAPFVGSHPPSITPPHSQTTQPVQIAASSAGDQPPPQGATPPSVPLAQKESMNTIAQQLNIPPVLADPQPVKTPTADSPHTAISVDSPAFQPTEPRRRRTSGGKLKHKRSQDKQASQSSLTSHRESDASSQLGPSFRLRFLHSMSSNDRMVRTFSDSTNFMMSARRDDWALGHNASAYHPHHDFLESSYDSDSSSSTSSTSSSCSFNLPPNLQSFRKYLAPSELNFDDFIPGRPLGQGSYGLVQLGMYQNQLVAIKSFQEPIKFESFWREVCILLYLRLPNLVVQVLGYTINPWCIVTERAEMGSLKDVLRRQQRMVMERGPGPSNEEDRLKQKEFKEKGELFQEEFGAQVLYGGPAPWLKDAQGRIEGPQQEKQEGSGTQTLLPMPSMMVFGPLPGDQAVWILYRVAVAMQNVHKKKIVHMDLTSSNILVFNAGKIVIADFGLACFRNDLPPDAESGGTILYMAPEFIRDRLKGRDYPADVYSFGMLIYEVVCTGHPPWTTQNLRNPTGYVRLHVPQDGTLPPLPHDMDPRLRFLFKACTQYESQNRPTFEQIVHFLQVHFTPQVKRELLNGVPTQQLLNGNIPGNPYAPQSVTVQLPTCSTGTQPKLPPCPGSPAKQPNGTPSVDRAISGEPSVSGTASTDGQDSHTRHSSRRPSSLMGVSSQLHPVKESSLENVLEQSHSKGEHTPTPSPFASAFAAHSAAQQTSAGPKPSPFAAAQSHTTLSPFASSQQTSSTVTQSPFANQSPEKDKLPAPNVSPFANQPLEHNKPPAPNVSPFANQPLEQNKPPAPNVSPFANQPPENSKRGVPNVSPFANQSVENNKPPAKNVSPFAAASPFANQQQTHASQPATQPAIDPDTPSQRPPGHGENSKQAQQAPSTASLAQSPFYVQQAQQAHARGTTQPPNESNVVSNGAQQPVAASQPQFTSPSFQGSPFAAKQQQPSTASGVNRRFAGSPFAAAQAPVQLQTSTQGKSQEGGAPVAVYSPFSSDFPGKYKHQSGDTAQGSALPSGSGTGKESALRKAQEDGVENEQKAIKAVYPVKGTGPAQLFSEQLAKQGSDGSSEGAERLASNAGLEYTGPASMSQGTSDIAGKWVQQGEHAGGDGSGHSRTYTTSVATEQMYDSISCEKHSAPGGSGPGAKKQLLVCKFSDV